MNREKLLNAVLERDARFDGTFVYGVTSTRIFCRPSCPSKRPKPENIALFASVEDARNAGFRACKRCDPQKWAARLQAIAEAARGESQSAGEHEMKAALGVSPRQMKQARQISQFKTELQKGKNVIESQNEAEFGSARATYEAAQKHLGMTPATYGKGGAGASVRFAFAPCALGIVMVARTEKGLCAVRLGEDEAVMEQQLREEFFAANIARDVGGLQGEIEAVLRLLEGQEPNFCVPLDVAATAWQWRVWDALRGIPRGETCSYSQLAAQMGAPQSARAVARACATNPLALVHPCHRVIGSDGNLRGFRWCIERKRRLLEFEKAVSPHKKARES